MGGSGYRQRYPNNFEYGNTNPSNSQFYRHFAGVQSNFRYSQPHQYSTPSQQFPGSRNNNRFPAVAPKQYQDSSRVTGQAGADNVHYVSHMVSEPDSLN